MTYITLITIIKDKFCSPNLQFMFYDQTFIFGIKSRFVCLKSPYDGETLLRYELFVLAKDIIHVTEGIFI